MKYLKNFKTFVFILVSIIMTSACSQAQTREQKPANDKIKQYQNNRPGQNFFNTAVYEINGKKYKLILIGDLLPQLSINGKPVAKDELDYYQEEIESLSNIIWERQRNEAERKNTFIEKVKQQILDDLIVKKLVPDKESVQSFYLTSVQLVINDKIQNPAAYKFFKAKYIKSDDRAFYYEKRFSITPNP